MRIFHTIAGLRCELDLVRQQQRRIGLVPTMGALHDGHLSAIARARAECDFVVVSIFVNPLQFEPGSDLIHYPRTLDSDRQSCDRAGVDVIFAPSTEQLYARNSVSSSDLEAATRVVPPKSMLAVLCAPHRPGHFEGVATVVVKLFNIVQPERAYFGQKDAQQLAIVRHLVSDLNVPVEIRACPTARESSGLALSSRNRYLSPEQQESAAFIYRSLQQAQAAYRAGERQAEVLLQVARETLATRPEVVVEYVELVHPATLMPLERLDVPGLLAIAAYVGQTRLIDNLVLGQRPPIVAIDGPAGAGKSTVTRQVAKRLGLLHLDTGAMYRAVTWLAMQASVAFDDEAAIAELAGKARIQLVATDDPESPVRVLVNGEDITLVIRDRAVTAEVSQIAAHAAVRRELVAQQRQWGMKGGIVAEGRDIGTHVFPDAELKIFLTASTGERARRRQRELAIRGTPEIDLDRLEREIQARDTYDSTRRVSPLQKATDAIEVVTDGMVISQVVDRIVELYRERVGT